MFRSLAVVLSALVLVVVRLGASSAGAFAQTEPLPVIVTYELQKAQRDARAEVRDPRAFWLHQIVARIESKISASPLRVKEPITVQLAFTVAHDGHLVSKSIIKSSGVEAADKAADTMVAAAAPFPPMPSSMTDEQLTFALPVRFR